MRLIRRQTHTGVTVTGKPLPVRAGKRITFAPKLDGVIPPPTIPTC